jgi:MFS family permease
VSLTAWVVCAAQGLVALALLLPVAAGWKIGLVVVQSLLLGLLNTIQQMYLMQCLGRGTTEEGRARSLKLTFTFGPIAAVAGSLIAQLVLRGGIPGLTFPRDFALLYFIGVPCSALTAWYCGRFELEPLEDEPRSSYFSYTWESIRHFLRDRPMACLWLGYLFWYATLQGFSNVSLFARHALGREPAAFAGVMMAIQFGTKAVAGYLIGMLYARQGVRAPLIACVAVLGLGMLWAWNVPGYLYLAAFALMGAGQLGGTYFPNVLLSWKKGDAARYMAVLNLAGMAAALAPTVHGFITDHWGFGASFVLGTATAAAAMAAVLLIPAPPRPETA